MTVADKRQQQRKSVFIFKSPCLWTCVCCVYYPWLCPRAALSLRAGAWFPAQGLIGVETVSSPKASYCVVGAQQPPRSFFSFFPVHHTDKVTAAHRDSQPAEVKRTVGWDESLPSSLAERIQRGAPTSGLAFYKIYDSFEVCRSLQWFQSFCVYSQKSLHSNLCLGK